LLAGAVDHYTFISSLNAYAQVNVDGIDESYPVGTLPFTNLSFFARAFFPSSLPAALADWQGRRFPSL
jgi:hypothetical protein